MFLGCSYFFAKSVADVLTNSVPIKRKACTSRTLCPKILAGASHGLWPDLDTPQWAIYSLLNEQT